MARQMTNQASYIGRLKWNLFRQLRERYLHPVRVLVLAYAEVSIQPPRQRTKPQLQLFSAFLRSDAPSVTDASHRCSQITSVSLLFASTPQSWWHIQAQLQQILVERVTHKFRFKVDDRSVKLSDRPVLQVLAIDRPRRPHRPLLVLSHVERAFR